MRSRALPDVDGDGAGDLAVGAPFAVLLNSPEPGEVFVHSGANGGLVHALGGTSGGDVFGRAVAHAGDANGDGIGDVLVGAPQPSGGRPGYARVYSGLDAGLLLDWGGDSGGDMFGSAVASLGDLNGDGITEVAVGAPGDDDNGSLSGAVRVFDGLSALTIYTVQGAGPNAEFGTALACLGDVNGDLTSEVANASPGFGSGAGRVQAMSGVALRMNGAAHLFSVAAATGSVRLDLDFGPQHAGRGFLALGAITGIEPGTPYGSQWLPLNRDRYFKKTLKLKPFGTLSPPQGTLDANGRAAVDFAPPGSSPATWLVGQTFHHAALVLDAAGNTLEASNAWPVTIVP